MRYHDTALPEGVRLRWNYRRVTAVEYRMAPLLDFARVLAAFGVAVFALAQPPSPGRIVYVHAPDGGPPWPAEDIYSMNADGSGVRALTTDGHSHDPAWSPDGRRILFVHDSVLPSGQEKKEPALNESRHAAELFLMDADGSDRRFVRRLGPWIGGAVWSPDGKTFAVTDDPEAWASRPNPMDRVGLFLLRADGRGEPRLLFRNAYTPAWSPDGKRLAFSAEQPRGLWSVHVANIDGSNDTRLTDPQNIGGSPAWSPDGKQIAFDEFVDQRRQQIFVMEADGSHVRQLTTSTSWSCGHPSWSPDGNEIVFSCRSASLPCGVVSSVGTILPECDRRIFTLSLRDPNARPKQLGEHDGAAPAFAPSRQP